jgi:hypothetical protein
MLAQHPRQKMFFSFFLLASCAGQPTKKVSATRPATHPPGIIPIYLSPAGPDLPLRRRWDGWEGRRKEFSLSLSLLLGLITLSAEAILSVSSRLSLSGARALELFSGGVPGYVDVACLVAVRSGERERGGSKGTKRGLIGSLFIREERGR